MIDTSLLTVGNTIKTRIGQIYTIKGPYKKALVPCTNIVTNEETLVHITHIVEVLERAQTKPRVRLPSQLDVQVGGSHYKDKGIQPVEYAHVNGLDFLQGSVVKYVSRHKTKNGAEDIKKAVHFLQFILEFQYDVRSEIKYDEVVK